MQLGYVRVWEPGHPLAAKDGYVLEHRKVVYDAGIEIPAGAQVHHRNGVRDDNRLENLEVKGESAHHRDHIVAAGFVRNQHGRFALRTLRQCERCGEPFMPWKPTGRFCSRVCANQR
jgi:hypothetical protein